MRAILPIPHEGPMNVSIIDTATNKAVGSPLIVFDSYADERLATLPANNTNFDVTMPTSLPTGACTQPGQCVLQWFWFGTAAKQTYESCVDFVMAQSQPGGTAGTGSGSGAGSGSESGTGSAAGSGIGSGAAATGVTSPAAGSTAASSVGTTANSGMSIA